MSIFNPSKQLRYTRDKDRCFIGKAPELSVVSISFGEKIAISWLVIQIGDLSEYTGCQDKMSIRQLEDTAMLILINYYYLKVTELMYFFMLFKSGYFGKFYGSVDGMVIMESLKSFLSYRNDAIDNALKKEEKKKIEEEQKRSSGEAITYEEWQRRKSLKKVINGNV